MSRSSWTCLGHFPRFHLPHSVHHAIVFIAIHHACLSINGNVHLMPLPPRNINSAYFLAICIYFPGLSGLYVLNNIEGKCTLLRALKAYRRSRGLTPFITWALKGSEGSAVRPGRCIPGEETSCTHWIGDYRLLLGRLNRYRRVKKSV
jgi:hypothetical protein